MFLLMSRSCANHDRGSWSVDFRSIDRESCERALADHEAGDRTFKVNRERIVVQVHTHADPSS